MIQRFVGILFLQHMSFNKGYEKHREEVTVNMLKELTQLDEGATPEKLVCIPQCQDILTNKDKKRSLDAINLIEEKRNGDIYIKATTYANCSKQRIYLKGFRLVAPQTVSLEGLLMNLIIGTYGRRNYISFGIPGAFLQAKFDDDKLLLL